MHSQNLPLTIYSNVYKNTSVEALYLSSKNLQNDNGNRLLVLIHGFNRFGAWEHLYPFGYDIWQKGYAVLLPSQLGFGGSGGKADYCGPDTVSSIADLVRNFAAEDGMHFSKIAVWGASRGAIVSALLIAKYPELFATGILQAGAYDFNKYLVYANLDVRIKTNILEESGGSDQALRDRSAILYAENISCPILIMHGAEDENVPVEQAKLLDRRLTELNKPHRTLILEDAGHRVSSEDNSKKYVFPFLDRILQE